MTLLPNSPLSQRVYTTVSHKHFFLFMISDAERLTDSSGSSAAARILYATNLGGFCHKHCTPLFHGLEREAIGIRNWTACSSNKTDHRAQHAAATARYASPCSNKKKGHSHNLRRCGGQMFSSTFIISIPFHFSCIISHIVTHKMGRKCLSQHSKHARNNTTSISERKGKPSAHQTRQKFSTEQRELACS